MEAEDALTIIHKRKEYMVSSTMSTPIFRLATFLKPSFTTVSRETKLPNLPSKTIPTNLAAWPSNVLFKGWANPVAKWTQWVDQLAPLYGSLWTRLGIHDAVMSSKYKIHKEEDLVLGLSAFWCSETNTFVFEWGEATITLEDMLVLGAYPVLGESITSPLSEDLVEIEQKLIKEHTICKRPPARKASDHVWMRHFMEENEELQHVAFLSLWLSRYVFPGHPYQTVSKKVFPLAIHLAHGRKIALAPAVLASVYRDLRLLKEGFSCSGSSKSMVVWGPLQLVQMWACERFPSLSKISPNQISPNEPRPARWHNLRLSLEFSDVKSIGNSLENFEWRPYALAVNNWRCLPFYKDKEDLVNVEGKDELLQSFAWCLRACNVSGLDGTVVQYCPHRVARQFGYDQDIPGNFSQDNVTCELAWRDYDKQIQNVEVLVRSRFLNLGVTERYHEWWTGSLAQGDGIHHKFGKPETSKSPSTEGHVSVEWMMSVKNLSVPPGFESKNINQKTEVSSSAQAQDSPSSSIARRVSEEKIIYVVESDEESITSVSGDTRIQIQNKKREVRDFENIQLDDKEEINTDRVTEPGVELEERIGKLEVLFAKLEEKSSS